MTAPVATSRTAKTVAGWRGCSRGCGVRGRRAPSAQRAGPAWGLGLRFLDHEQHQGLHWRIEMEADDAADLVDQPRAGGQQRRLRPVWRRCERLPDPRDRRGPHARGAAIDLADQRVAFFGLSSSVLTMTRSTSASVILHGAPGRGSSHRPSRPRSRKRRRQVPTMSGAIRSRRDTSTTECPSAHSNTIRDR